MAKPKLTPLRVLAIALAAIAGAAAILAAGGKEPDLADNQGAPGTG